MDTTTNNEPPDNDSDEPTTDVTVTVEVPTPDPVTEPETGPVTIIETNGGDNTDSVMLTELLELREYRANMEVQINSLVARIDGLEYQGVIEVDAISGIAASVSEVETAVEMIELGEQESSEQDSIPDRVHGFFRPWGKK